MTNLPKFSALKVLGLIIGLTMIAIEACRKVDYGNNKTDTYETDRTTRFFEMKGDVTNVVKRIAKVMEEQNKKSEFITNLSKLGYPVWDKCPTIYPEPNLSYFLGGENSDTLVYIPFIDEDSTSVTGFLACIVDADSIKMRLFNSYKYEDYPFDAYSDINELSAETIASVVNTK